MFKKGRTMAIRKVVDAKEEKLKKKKAKEPKENGVVIKAAPKKQIKVLANSAISRRMRENETLTEVVGSINLEKLDTIFRCVIQSIKDEIVEKGHCSIIGLGTFKKVHVPKRARYVQLMEATIERESYDKIAFKPTGGMRL